MINFSIAQSSIRHSIILSPQSFCHTCAYSEFTYLVVPHLEANEYGQLMSYDFLTSLLHEQTFIPVGEPWWEKGAVGGATGTKRKSPSGKPIIFNLFLHFSLNKIDQMFNNGGKRKLSTNDNINIAQLCIWWKHPFFLKLKAYVISLAFFNQNNKQKNIIMV